MAEASASYHESQDKLRNDTQDMHRALVSVQEELEAIDWYQQRIDATSDAELAAILAHNRDDEKEHAAMVLEWLRRRDPGLDEELQRFLWHPEALAEELADAAAGNGAGESSADAGVGEAPTHQHGSLGIGSLKGERQR